MSAPVSPAKTIFYPYTCASLRTRIPIFTTITTFLTRQLFIISQIVNIVKIVGRHHRRCLIIVTAAPVVRTGGRRKKKLGDRDGRGRARGMGTETLLKEHKKRVARLR